MSTLHLLIIVCGIVASLVAIGVIAFAIAYPDRATALAQLFVSSFADFFKESKQKIKNWWNRSKTAATTTTTPAPTTSPSKDRRNALLGILITTIALSVLWKTNLFGQTATGVITAIVITFPAWFTVGTIFLANFDIGFTFVGEGTAKIIVSGGKKNPDGTTKEGEYVRTIYSRNYRVNTIEERNPDGTIKKLVGELEKIEGDVKINHWNPLNWTGARWIGVPWIYSIYRYKFEWTSAKTSNTAKPGGEDNTGVTTMTDNAEILDYILIKDAVYAHIVKNAETSEKAPMAVHYLITVKARNPEKALFGIHRWLDAIQQLTGAAIRSWVASQDYETLLQTGGQNTETKTHQNLNKVLQVVEDQMRKDYGVEFVTATLLSVDPDSDDATRLREATLKDYFAKTEGTARETAAKHEAAARIKLAEATAKEGEARAAETGALVEKLQGKDGKTVVATAFIAAASKLTDALGKKG